MPIADRLDTTEANRFEAAIGPDLFRSATIFPLHGILPDGSCACRAPICKAGPGKHPSVKWKDEHYPNGSKEIGVNGGIGIGLATGSRSGGLVVLDLDQKGGVDGVAALAELEQVYGPLPPTFTVEGPAGGRHLYFRTSPAHRYKSTQSEIAEGIDVRAEGGMVVLPGSPHRKGGVYRVAEDTPPAVLPDAWLGLLAYRNERAPLAPVVPDRLLIAPQDLRQRLADTVKGKRGEEWAALRHVVAGERMFRLEGGPGAPDDLPLVHGVDVFMTQSVLWALVNADDWYQVAPEDVATLFAPSLSILRQDADVVGTGSKWVPEHLAEKWAAAAGKVAADVAQIAGAEAIMAEAVSTAKASPLPWIVVQTNDRWAVLDDRDPLEPRYVECQKSVVVKLCRQAWAGKGRPLTKPGPKGATVDMTPDDVALTYEGVIVSGAFVDYTVTTPRVSHVDMTYTRGPRRPAPPPRAQHDPEVAAWLAALAGPDLDMVTAWIVWARADRCANTIPALTMIGGSHVGKSLLADGLARTMGLHKAAPLKRALGRFRATLADSPILFSDEGLPLGDNGKPLTEEFRTLITSTAHSIEQKGTDDPLTVLGGVRVVLAANKADRLFSNRGNLNGHDVTALLRRLLVIEIEDEGRIADAKRRAVALGACEGDPIRLERVAGHLRWIQDAGAPRAAAPSPRAGALGAELRKGGDTAAAALGALEDVTSGQWAATAPGLVWVRPEAWARAAGLTNGPGPLMRAIAAYVARPSAPRQTHPVTRAVLERRERWAALDLERLAKDGIDLTGLDPAGTPR